jgi:hypothetical protein
LGRPIWPAWPMYKRGGAVQTLDWPPLSSLPGRLSSFGVRPQKTTARHCRQLGGKRYCGWSYYARGYGLRCRRRGCGRCSRAQHNCLRRCKQRIGAAQLQAVGDDFRWQTNTTAGIGPDHSMQVIGFKLGIGFNFGSPCCLLINLRVDLWDLASGLRDDSMYPKEISIYCCVKKSSPFSISHTF